MNEQIEFEVDYLAYCNNCRYYDLAGNLDPCNDCLAQPYNYNTVKPVFFEEKKKKGERSG